MNLCQFTAVPDRAQLLICGSCGKKILNRGTRPPEVLCRAISAPELLFPCSRRGEQLRMAECDMCCGERGQLFPVLACAVDGECSVLKRRRRLKSCAACQERLP